MRCERLKPASAPHKTARPLPPGRLIKAITINMAVPMSERTIHYTGLKHYVECSRYDFATQYDDVELK